MIIKYDSLNRYEQPNIHLCNPGSVYNNGNLTNAIGTLSYITDLEISFNFNSISEANFRIHLADQDSREKSAIVKNIYKMVQNRRLLFFDDIGYFMITSVKESVGDDGRYKDITASSIEEEINNTGVPYVDNGTYRFYTSPTSTTSDRFTISVDTQKFQERYVFGGTYELEYYSSMNKWRTIRPLRATDRGIVEYVDLETCGITANIVNGGFLNGDKITVTLSTIGWRPTVTYSVHESGLINVVMQKLPLWTLNESDIDDNVKNLFRTFNDVNTDAKCFEFMINEIQEAYECIFLFDCINRTIKVKHKDNYIVPTNIHLSNDDFITLQKIEENAEDLCTAISIRDSGNTVTVGAVNPTGGNTIYDFSYYLDWMSDHLRPAVVRWMAEYESGLNGYKETSLEFWRAKNILMDALLEKERLLSLIDMYKQCGENITASNDVIAVTESYNKALKDYDKSGVIRTLEYQRYTATVDNGVFRTAVHNEPGVYVFKFHSDDTSWYLQGDDDSETAVTLSEYGINVLIVGTGLENDDTITVTFTNGTDAPPIDIGEGTVADVRNELNARISDCTLEIQRLEIETVGPADARSHEYEALMSNLNADLEFAVKENGLFDEAQLEELQQYIYEGIYTDDNVTFTESMSLEEQFEQMDAIFGRARDMMKNVSRPTQSFSIDSENFIFIKEFSDWTSQLEAGCIVNIETDDYQRYSVHVAPNRFAAYVSYQMGTYTFKYDGLNSVWRFENNAQQVNTETAGILISVLDSGLVNGDKFTVTIEDTGVVSGKHIYEANATVDPVGYNNISRLFLSGMNVNYEDATLSMTFGSRMRRCDTKSLYDNALGAISKSANSISYIKDAISPIYEAKDANGENYYTKTARSIQDMRNLSMDKALSSSGQDVQIDGAGITIRKQLYDGTDPTGCFSDNQIKITSNMIAMTKDGWDTASAAIGEFDVVTEDGQESKVYGVNAELLVGDVIVGESLHIKDESGNEQFKVIDDRIEGAIESIGDVSTAMSNVTQTASELSVEVSKIIDNGVSSVTTNTNYTFDSNGLSISDDERNVRNTIDKYGMTVTRGRGAMENVVLSATENGVSAQDVTARGYLRVGTYSIMKDFKRGYDEHRTACFYTSDYIEDASEE